MKKILMLIGIIMLAGCTYTATSEMGNPIEQEKVALIEKGKTTENQILSMFGNPFTKVVINDTDTKWIYQHIISNASSQMYTGKTSSSLNNDVLDILFRNGIVVNFTHSKSDTKPTTEVKSSL